MRNHYINKYYREGIGHITPEEFRKYRELYLSEKHGIPVSVVHAEILETIEAIKEQKASGHVDLSGQAYAQEALAILKKEFWDDYSGTIATNMGLDSFNFD